MWRKYGLLIASSTKQEPFLSVIRTLLEENGYPEAFMKMASKPHSMGEPAEDPWATALIPYMSADVWRMCRCYIWNIFWSTTTLHSSWLMTKTCWRSSPTCMVYLEVEAVCTYKKELFRPKSKGTKLVPGEGKWKNWLLQSMPGDAINRYCGKKPMYWTGPSHHQHLHTAHQEGPPHCQLINKNEGVTISECWKPVLNQATARKPDDATIT